MRGPDGQRVIFTGHQGSFTPGPGVQADLKCTGNQKTCTVTQWDGTTWTVTGTQLDSYTDANGEGLSFVRNSATQTTVKLATTDEEDDLRRRRHDERDRADHQDQDARQP